MFSTMPHVFTPGKICCPTKHVFHSNIILGGRNSSSCFDSFTPAVYFLLKSQPPPIWQTTSENFLKRRRKNSSRFWLGTKHSHLKRNFCFILNSCSAGNVMEAILNYSGNFLNLWSSILCEAFDEFWNILVNGIYYFSLGSVSIYFNLQLPE